MNEMVTIEIDGKPYQARKGSMVIQVADEHGVVIPRFCYHKELSIAANCRMCLVEVEKVAKPMPACATPVANGMKVYTRSPKALAAQRSVVEFLLINHPLDCPVCDQGGECPLQDQAMGFGKGISRFAEGKRAVPDKDFGPLVATAMTRCIHCTRCVRYLDEIAGLHELGGIGRGERVEISNYIAGSLASEISGNIIDLCPVGALLSKPYRHTARPWELTARPSIAPHDSIGSNVDMHVRRNRVMRVVPRENAEINNIWLSDRDRFGYEGLYSEDRLTAPRIKRDGVWREVDWEEALEFTANRLGQVLREHRPADLSALVAPNATLEEMYLLQKLMRGLGSPHIDHRVRQGDFTGQEDAPVYPWLGQSLTDLEKLDAALLVGSNVRKDQPLAAYRLRRAALRGARVMAVNPLDYPFHFPVAENIVADPNGMVRALAGIARTLLHAVEGSAPPGLSDLLAEIRPTATERTIAEQLREAKNATVLLGNQALAHPDLAALRVLAISIADMSGACFGYLPEAANSVGAWLAGALPHREAAGSVAPHIGLDARAMLRSGLKAFLLLGLEPELDCWDSAAALEALREAELVVSLSGFRTPVMESYAHAMLPIGAFAETSGTYVNAEGRWQSFAAAAAAPGDARPAWKVLRVLGNLMGLADFEYDSSEQVRDELRSLCGDMRPDTRGRVSTSACMPAASNGLMRVGDVPIYALDSLVRRAGSLQQTPDAEPGAAYMCSALATDLGVLDRPSISVQQGDVAASLPLCIDDRVPYGCVRIPAGTRVAAGLGPTFGAVSIEGIAIVERRQSAPVGPESLSSEHEPFSTATEVETVPEEMAPPAVEEPVTEPSDAIAETGEAVMGNIVTVAKKSPAKRVAAKRTTTHKTATANGSSKRTSRRKPAGESQK